MSPLESFLVQARKLATRRDAAVWTVRGTAVCALAMIALQVVGRWRPASFSAHLAAIVTAAATFGGVVAMVGWFSTRPSLADVATVADHRLGSRERLATAWQFGGAGGGLAALQQSDAEVWLADAEPHRVLASRLPRRELFVALAAVLVAGLLVALPNSSSSRQQSERRQQAARLAAADRVAGLARQVSRGRPGEDAGRRDALVQELRTAEESLRRKDSIAAGVATLSRAQDAIRVLAEPSGIDRQSAASAAGAELSGAGAAAGAGAALAGLGNSGAQELEDLAASLPGLSPDAQAGLVSQAANTADAAGDHPLGDKLRQAAGDLAAGRSAAGQALLEAAAEAQDEQAANRAAAEFAALGQSLPSLSPPQQAELSQVMRRAGEVAAADPDLADSLRRASEATRDGRSADVAAALEAARRRAQRNSADRGLDADASAASDGIQSAKNALLKSLEAGSDTPGPKSPHKHACGMGHEGMAHDEASVTTGPGETSVATTRPSHGMHDHGCSGESSAGDGSSSQGASEGSGGQGEQAGGGAGSGPSSGGGGGEGGGDHRGSGSSGAQGSLGESPGLPNEQVYAPGVSGAGRARALPSESASNGAAGPLVPYESVYAEYRAAALTQADRQMIPDRLRELLRQYFQEASP